MAYFKSRVHPFIRAFIISDALLYSSLNIVNILFVVYVTSVAGGTVESATMAMAIGFSARIIVELAIGQRVSRLSEARKLTLIMLGMACMSISYGGFAFATTPLPLSALWVLNGVGWALAHPSKLALVAKNINHDQASQEWGFTDALNMTLVVITMLLGSFIVTNFSYSLLFLLAALINAIGMLPFWAYSRALGRASL